MGESRRFTRIPYQSEVLINSNGHWFRGESENLSLYGIYIRMIDKIPQDSVIDLTISLPETEPNAECDSYIDVNGVVVRRDPGGIGCEFRQVDVDAFLNLKNVISSKADDQSFIMEEFYSYLSRKELMAS